MWLALTKYFVYLSFILNIACGVWVFFGIVRWIRDLNRHWAPPGKAGPTPSADLFLFPLQERSPSGLLSRRRAMLPDMGFKERFVSFPQTRRSPECGGRPRFFPPHHAPVFLPYRSLCNLSSEAASPCARVPPRHPLPRRAGFRARPSA